MALFVHPAAKTNISLIIARDHTIIVRSGEFCRLLVHSIPLYYLFGRKARFLSLGDALKLETDLHKAAFFALPAIYLALHSDAGSISAVGPWAIDTLSADTSSLYYYDATTKNASKTITG
jgi:hypothetical protein